jgi:hypothetical protein
MTAKSPHRRYSVLFDQFATHHILCPCLLMSMWHLQVLSLGPLPYCFCECMLQGAIGHCAELESASFSELPECIRHTAVSGQSNGSAMAAVCKCVPANATAVCPNTAAASCNTAGHPRPGGYRHGGAQERCWTPAPSRYSCGCHPKPIPHAACFY